MSEETAFGLVFIEKLTGIIIAIIGAALTYYTYTTPNAVGMALGFFIAAGLVLITLGIILTLTKTE